MATYYAQRAQAGLIISEGTQPSATGQGYPNTPGLHTDAQQAGWARIADAVHAAGGRIIVQLMHVGRTSNTATSGHTPVSATSTPATGEIFTTDGMQPYSIPRELATSELPAVSAEFANAAHRAVAAGADGVELHAANGYLLHQFLADGVNTRTDAYGGSPEHRTRFVVETAQATAAAIGADRVGIRFSPGHPFNDTTEDDLSVYEVLARELAQLGLAYLHVLAEPSAPILGRLRALWPGALVLNTGFELESDRDEFASLISTGIADAVAVGRPFLANPDLVERWTSGAALNPPDQATFYGGDERGYTDYPELAMAS